MKSSYLNNVSLPGRGMISKGFGFQPRTLNDFISAIQGGTTSRQYGSFDAGTILKKDITATGAPFAAGDFFTNTFGAKVWDSLNSQTRSFNIFPKDGMGSYDWLENQV